jgi:hypothetical protein
VSKVRVHELAKELGVSSKDVLAKLHDLGEFVKSASSTVEPPVVRKLRESMPPPVDAPAPVKKTAAKKTAAAAPPLGGRASLIRRTTGGSSVEDADFTNSPSSCALARTSLLVYPSSFASSWTRTFDTTLLSWSGRGAPDRQCKRYTFMLACSWGVHPRTPDPLVR